jgi:hypothetical protein
MTDVRAVLQSTLTFEMANGKRVQFTTERGESILIDDSDWQQLGEPRVILVTITPADDEPEEPEPRKRKRFSYKSGPRYD